MAMEYRHTILDAHSKNITSFQYNSFRREIYTCGEDAIIRVWEAESGKLLGTWAGHSGWITSLLYCKEIKILFSCSIDGLLIAWGPSGKIIQKTGFPLYALGCRKYNRVKKTKLRIDNSRHHQIMAGHNKKVRLFQLMNPEESHSGTEVLEKKSVTCSEHSEIVSCIISCEGRFYSTGFDRKINIYEVSHLGDMKIKVASTIPNAHDAAISCMIFAKDADNSWIITGSFDRIVKLWSLDGNLLIRFEGFSDTITSLTYVVPTQTLWITANSTSPIIYDPRSGINVSDFIQTDDEKFRSGRGAFSFKHLCYIPESNEIIGTTSRRSVTIWKYNPVAPCTILPGHADIVECLCFTAKEPILIFSGGDDGIIRKWERMQLNTFMYSQETLALPVTSVESDKTVQIDDKKSIKNIKMEKTPSKKSCNHKIKKGFTSRPSISVMAYFEDLDLLISGYEDARICIWGYNDESEVELPAAMRDLDMEGGDKGVSNRVSGMSLKHTFYDHKDAITGIACVPFKDEYYVLTTGWDRRICLWDMKQFKMTTLFQSNTFEKSPELAADGIILDLEYCAERQEFAYASADKQAYIRRFSTKGDEMTLVAVLQGHEAEVTQIKWHKKQRIWITGSEDRTIRIWPPDGIPALRIINNEGPVTALCIDMINGCVISGSLDKIIRVFDLDRKDEVVQKNQGHTDEIRSIIHIPARNQYISASWDNSVRVWNAHFKKGQRRIALKEGANNTTTHIYEDFDENKPTFADLNPLLVPRMLAKGMYIQNLGQERPIEEEEQESLEQSRLEEDLRSTLNELELALSAPDKMTSKKGVKTQRGNQAKQELKKKKVI